MGTSPTEAVPRTMRRATNNKAMPIPRAVMAWKWLLVFQCVHFLGWDFHFSKINAWGFCDFFCENKSVGPLILKVNRLFPCFIGTGKRPNHSEGFAKKDFGRANQHVVKVKLESSEIRANPKYTPWKWQGVLPLKINGTGKWHFLLGAKGLFSEAFAVSFRGGSSFNKTTPRPMAKVCGLIGLYSCEFFSSKTMPQKITQKKNTKCFRFSMNLNESTEW